jgi:hypothetical protein
MGRAEECWTGLEGEGVADRPHCRGCEVYASEPTVTLVKTIEHR